MSITETKVPNEILIRYAEDGTIQGAHVAFLETVLRDGEVLSRKIVGPHPMGTVEFPTDVILSQALTDALTSIEALNAEKAELEKQLAERPESQPEIPTDPSIPSVVTMAQAKLALLYAGLYEQVEQALADLPEPQKTAALIEWNHRQTLERGHPLVGQVADGLGLTEQQLDELFLDASVR